MPGRRLLRLLAAALAAGALALPAAASAGCRDAGLQPHAGNLKRANAAVLCLLNVQRAHHGLRPLHESRKLDRAAMRWSHTMVARRIFAHADMLGRIRASGYLQGAGAWTVGENIAWGMFDWGTPRHIVNDWMNSPGHRANILSRSFRDIGLGVATGTPVGRNPGGTYTTDFGARS
jgi:uncharacterized protein YkwD